MPEPADPAPRNAIAQEIRDHDKWCGPACTTFLPDEYRRRRLAGETAEALQRNYDSCHIWR